jgi:hypothetical protein
MNFSGNWGLNLYNFYNLNKCQKPNENQLASIFFVVIPIFLFFMTLGCNLMTFSIAYFIQLRISWEFDYEFGKSIATCGKTLPRLSAVESVEPREENISS